MPVEMLQRLAYHRGRGLRGIRCGISVDRGGCDLTAEGFAEDATGDHVAPLGQVGGCKEGWSGGVHVGGDIGGLVRCGYAG